MQNNKPAGDFPRKADEQDFSIFQNQEAVVDNIKDAAKTVGAGVEGIDKLKDGKPLEFLIARKNCKQCWGRGVVNFVPNEKPTRRTTTADEIARLSSAGSTAAMPRFVRDTSQPEDLTERHERMTKALCKCVKIRME